MRWSAPIDTGAILRRTICVLAIILSAAELAKAQGGDQGALLYRPAGGSFAKIVAPSDLVNGAKITAIAMPSPEQAWLATSSGL